MTEQHHTNHLIRTAYHEAGHAVASIAMGLPVDLVSIRPTERYRGVTILDLSGGVPGRVPGRYAIEQPDEPRRLIEARLVSLMAGELAEQYAGDAAGYRSIEAVAHAEVVTEALARLRPRHRELLAQAETDSDHESDAEQISRSAMNWTGTAEEATAYAAYLAAVARRFMVYLRWDIARVAEALLEHGVLDGDAVRSLIRTPMPAATATPAPVPLLAIEAVVS